MQSDTVITPERRSSLWPAKALRRARDVHPVWAVNIIVLSLALVLYLGPARGLAPIASPQVPWWLVAVGFALAERCVVHLHFRRGAHSFSLGDIPLVFGLLFCSAEGVIAACLLGSGIMLLLDRRPPPIKFAFNIANFALHDRHLMGHGVPPGGVRNALCRASPLYETPYWKA